MLGEVLRKGFWHEPDGTPTSKAIALKEWALVAHEVLQETAGTYHAVLHDDALAEQVQDRANIRTSHPVATWLPQTLLPVIHLCHRAGEPPLTALVVGRDGRVGEGYADVLTVTEQAAIMDPAQRERHAAHARLECYRWAGSAPPDGGVAHLPESTRPAARVARTPAEPRARAATRSASPRKPAKSDRPTITCPRCFMALPATGLCDNCD